MKLQGPRITIIVKKRGEKKRWKRPWFWRVKPKQGQGLCGERSLCLEPTNMEKALGNLKVGV